VVGRLVHTGLGSSSLVAHVLPYPPPPPCKHLCTRSCSNKHSHTKSGSRQCRCRLPCLGAATVPPRAGLPHAPPGGGLGLRCPPHGPLQLTFLRRCWTRTLSQAEIYLHFIDTTHFFHICCIAFITSLAEHLEDPLEPLVQTASRPDHPLLTYGPSNTPSPRQGVLNDGFFFNYHGTRHRTKILRLSSESWKLPLQNYEGFKKSNANKSFYIFVYLYPTLAGNKGILLQDLVQSCLRGGGGHGRTCATRDDELRPVWTRLPITH
jgi:hypothetical protein